MSFPSRQPAAGAKEVNGGETPRPPKGLAAPLNPAFERYR